MSLGRLALFAPAGTTNYGSRLASRLNMGITWPTVLVARGVMGLVSLVAFKIVDLTIGLRVTEEQEREGLDTVSHGERAYNG